MSAFDKADRMVFEEAVRAGVLPEVLVHGDASEWWVEQKELSARVRFASREQAMEFARTWCRDNPPCVVKIRQAWPGSESPPARSNRSSDKERERMDEQELAAIERRLEAGDQSRAAQDVRRLLEEVRTLRGFIDQAKASAARDVLRDPPIP